MKKISLRSGLLATTTICGAVMSTMAAGALVATVATLLPATAQAQDYTSGAVAISVRDSNGAPVPGATVTITSQAQGISKTLTTSANGSATATGLSAGEYDVSVAANGFDTYTGSATVVVSQEVTYTYALNTTGASTTVVVKGKRVRQDFNRTTAGLSVDLTTLTSQQAIGRNIESVMLLAPTTIRSQNASFDEPSIGGGSAAENAFYINGLNVTNPDTYVGGAEVPFDFYKTVDVQSSGYAAEFGRATGGVVNATTKSGTNDFMFAIHGNFAPDNLRSTPFVTDDTTTPSKYLYNKGNSVSIESGGALLKDKLFLYGLVQMNDDESRYASTGGTYQTTTTKDPFYGAKLDWYLTPQQHFEATYFDTTSTSDITRSQYTGTASDGSDGVIGAKIGTATQITGGQNYVLKYTGNVTNWFTISAAYGDNKDNNIFNPGDPTQPYGVLYSFDTKAYQKISKLQPFSASITNVATERKFYRADGDLRFEAAGRHHVRFGYDQEDLSMTKTLRLPGAQPIRYYVRPVFDASGNVIFNPALAHGKSSYAYIIYENMGGHVSAKDSSFYIQDSWDITPNLNITYGLRDDDFKQNNLSGQQYLSLTGNVAPRIGLSWKPGEDSKWRFTAFYGQYYIPPAMNLGFRGKDLYYYEYFDMPTGGWQYDGTTGLPVDMGTPWTDYDHCPASDAGSAPGHIQTDADACSVYGSGTQEPAAAKAAVGLKATRESEVTLGASYRANDLWNFGLTYVHRTLDRVSEDTDFAPLINEYCAGVATDEQLDDGACSYANEYHVWNVGQTVTINTFSTLPDGTKQLTLKNLDFPTPKRDYDALTFDFKRAFDGKWGVQGSYTWSKSYGNYEGTVLTIGDGTGQTDAGSTILYDYSGLSENSTGYLANDRTHQFKIWGTYAITPDLLVGANVAIISPAKLSCLGTYPTRDTDDHSASADYGAVSHFCYNKSTDSYDAAPQGAYGESDWTRNVDLSLRYTLPSTFSLGGKLVLRADVFNLFNNKQIISRDMTSDTGVAGDPNDRFYEPYQYNSARYMRVGFDLQY